MQTTATPGKANRATYAKVFDSRRRRVRGLWQRNGRLFANLTISDDLGSKTSRMLPLSGTTLDDAKADYRRVQVERDDDRLRPLGLPPKLADFLGVHEQQSEVSGKRASSVEKEKALLRHWRKQLPPCRNCALC